MMRRRLVPVCVGIGLALGAVAAGPVVAAPAATAKRRPPPPKAAAAPSAEEIARLQVALVATDPEVAAHAADALGAIDAPAAHDALLDALAMGMPPAVATSAITALAAHPAPPDVTALVRYAHHHNLNVRAAALTALAMYGDAAAHTAVLEGLHDAAGLVRGAAAAAAAKGHIRASVEPLFQLLGRGEEPAARALAALADPDLVAKIADQLGKVPDAALAQCLGYILKRPDFGPDPARVEVIRAIAKIQDPAAVNALTDYIDLTPKNPPRPSRAEAEKLVEARLGGGK
jgi:HEAT repeat protein